MLRGLSFQQGFQGFLDGARTQIGGSTSSRKRGQADRRGRAQSDVGAGGSKDGMAALPEMCFSDAWRSYCATNPRLRDPRTLPALIRRELPNELRREVWSHCLGIELGEIGAQVPETEMEDLPDGTDPLIEADLTRTFPNSAEFQEVGGTESLRRMLRYLVIVDPDLGYCQSLNFLAAVLLMMLLNEASAVLAVRTLLVKLGTRSWYTDGMVQLRADTVVLEELMKERLPGVDKVFRAHNFELLFLASKWFLALFATTLEGETLRRVWDVVLCDGIEAVFRVAFALLHRHSEAAMQCEDIDELMILFQGMQTDWSPETLISAAYKPVLGKGVPAFPGRAELAQRRSAAAAKISSADARADIRNVIIWRGGVRPGSCQARLSREQM